MAQISYKDIARVVVDQLEHQPANEVARALASYLVEQRRAGELDRIMREALRIREQEASTVEVTTSSRHPLSQELKQQITALFDGKQVLLNEELQEDLVGGVRIQSLETEIDLSVRGQLNQLRSHKF